MRHYNKPMIEKEHILNKQEYKKTHRGQKSEVIVYHFFLSFLQVPSEEKGKLRMAAS
jgi:hypothetical protein